MKREIINLAAIVLASSLTLGLTGCGARTKATDAEVPMEEETIVVTDNNEDEGDYTEETVDAVTEENVASDEGETVGGNIIFYTDWLDIFPDEPDTYFEWEAMDEEVTVENDALVTIGGREVGYIKAGTTIRLIEHGINSGVYHVENTSGIGYEYVYITGNDLMTLDDMKELAEKHLGNSEFITILDAPEADMEYIEFSTQKGRNAGVENYICECLDNDNFRSTDYTVFYVDCNLTGERGNYMVDYKVYYK